MVNPDKPLQIREIIARTLFGVLPADALDDFCSKARIERYEIPSLLSPAGEVLANIRLVVEGHIEVIARSIGGEEVSIADIGPGGWATWLGCFVDAKQTHDLCSSAPACYIVFSSQTVKQLCAAHPVLYPLIMEEIAVRTHQLMEWTGQSVLASPEQRMARLIHLLARTQAIGEFAGTLHATQTRLARLARCSRQSANLLLGSLEKRGLIRLAYGKFEIPSMQRLVEFSSLHGTG
jgi:CRP/FNR family cyclic AMP-dependent transcriptional regulator